MTREEREEAIKFFEGVAKRGRGKFSKLAIEALEQPEIIYCKNCEHNESSSEAGNANCNKFYGMTDQMGFCHYGERRADE